MIEMSVCLPFWKAIYIGWLPFESLIRQVDIDFEWELIIIEEKEPFAMGKEKIMEYEERLRKVGCVNIKYISLKDWIPLGKKIMMLIKECNDTSKIFTWTAADCYFGPKSLSIQYKAFKDYDIDWMLTEKTLYYNIKDGRVLIDDKAIAKRKDDCMEKGFSMDIVRQISAPYMNVKKHGIDGGLHSELKRIRSGADNVRTHTDRSENWRDRFSTHGLNMITHGRASFFDNPTDEFRRFNGNFYNRIPNEIVQRLIYCKRYVGKQLK